MFSITIVLVVVIGAVMLAQSILVSKRASKHPMDVLETSPEHPNHFQTKEQVIRVSKVKREELDRVMTAFSTLYKMSDFQKRVQWIPLHSDTWVGECTEPLGFEEFCYLVNYLENPLELKWNAEVRGWTGFVSEKEGPANFCPEAMMIFTADVMDEPDAVQVTSASGIGYRFSFKNRSLEFMGEGAKSYEHPPLVP